MSLVCLLLLAALFATHPKVFSSPGQSPGRAVALPLASASTFTLKVFKSLYFPDHLTDLVHIWYDDRCSSKVLFSNTPAHYLKVKVRSRSWTLKFLILKIFKSSYFPNYKMDFVHIWYDDRYSSKVLFSNNMPIPMTSRSRSQT